MRQSPYLRDPRDLLAHHVALAVPSSMEELEANHVRAAEHQAELAKASGLRIEVPIRRACRHDLDPAGASLVTSDIARLRSLPALLDEMLRPGIGEGDEQAIVATQSEIEAAWPDARLMEAHRPAKRQIGGLEQDALAANVQLCGRASR